MPDIELNKISSVTINQILDKLWLWLFSSIQDSLLPHLDFGSVFAHLFRGALSELLYSKIRIQNSLMCIFDWRAKTIAVRAPFWVAWQKCCPSTSPWEFPNKAINHMQHTLCQVLKHGDEPSDYESSCLCYYSYIEDLGLHAVYILHIML